MARPSLNKPAIPGVMELGLRLAVLLAASYGMLAFSYKYYVPSLGGWGDSLAYYGLYQAPLNLHAGIAPFVLRQVSVVLTWLAWKSHMFYPNFIAFANPGYDQHIFFAALLVNWLSLLFAGFVAGLIAEELLGFRDTPTAVLAGFFCLFSFHAQLNVMTDLAEGPGWLLLALAVLALLRHCRVWLGVVLALAVFQRELVLVAIGCLAISQFFPLHAEGWKAFVRHHRFTLFALAAALLGAVAYVLLRQRSTDYAFQVESTPLLAGMLQIPFSRSLFFQVFVSQNIVLLAVLPAVIRVPGLPRLRYWMPRALIAFFVVVLVALSASADNNAGRLGAMLTPFFAAFAALWLTQRGAARQDAEVPRAPRRSHRNVSRWVLLAFVFLLFMLNAGGRVYRRFGPKPVRTKHEHARAVLEPYGPAHQEVRRDSMPGAQGRFQPLRKSA